MGRRQHKRNTKVLWWLLLQAFACNAVLHFLPTLTGSPLLDGIIGLVLGLYICAHPAANAVNMSFFERDALRQASEWSLVPWLALNLLVLLAGWMVVFLGISRLVSRAAWMVTEGQHTLNAASPHAARDRLHRWLAIPSPRVSYHSVMQNPQILHTCVVS
jgi:hypothetical protein